MAVIGGLVFTSCKKDAAQENLDNKLDSITEKVEDTLNAVEEQVEDTVESLEAKIKEAQAELDKAVTVEEKQAATKKLNEAKAALETLKGNVLSTAEEAKQEANAAAKKAGDAAKNTVKNTEKKVEEVKTQIIKAKEGTTIKSAEEGKILTRKTQG